MLTLGIETSCDETAAAVLKDGHTVLSNIIRSQTDIHAPFGGVVPEIAYRAHLFHIEQVVQESLHEAGCKPRDIDLVSVTRGPGLMGALLIGVAYAEQWAWALDKPVIGVNHLEAHLCAGLLEHVDLDFPFIGLVISGGHTLLVHAKALGSYEVLGRTRDDAVGEAYDKVASLLSLPYPGGPAIDALAKKGDPKRFDFPRPMLRSNDFNFSFSGLKTSVLYMLKDFPPDQIPVADIAASFQKAVTDVLLAKVVCAMDQKQANKIVFGGGVAANSEIRSIFNTKVGINIKIYFPSKLMCTDNALMIANIGYLRYQNGLTKDDIIDADDHWML